MHVLYYLLNIQKILHKSLTLINTILSIAMSVLRPHDRTYFIFLNLVNTILPIATRYVRTIGPTLSFNRELIRAHLLDAHNAVTINLPALGRAFGHLRNGHSP